jgi:hypothetical protein
VNDVEAEDPILLLYEKVIFITSFLGCHPGIFGNEPRITAGCKETKLDIGVVREEIDPRGTDSRAPIAFFLLTETLKPQDHISSRPRRYRTKKNSISFRSELITVVR